MNTQQVEAVERCAALSLAHEIDFATVVQLLTEAGVERYHADYCRGELTYYWPAGQSHVIASHPTPDAIGEVFVASEVEAAVRASQRGEHTYADFVRKTKTAGCVGYFVQLAGHRTIYFGRHGDSHVEHFPTSP